MEIRARKVLECYKLGKMNSEDQNSDKNADSKGQTSDNVYYTQLIFCPCPEILEKSEIKGSGLINLVEKFTKHPSVRPGFFSNWQTYHHTFCAILSKIQNVRVLEPQRFLLILQKA